MEQASPKGRVVGFLALGALLALVGVAIYSARDGGRSGSAASRPAPPIVKPAAPEPKSEGEIQAVLADVELSPQARVLAERITCVCGCGDILAECTCDKTPGSRDMKKYLQTLVDEGKSPAEVEQAMVARYGQAAVK